LCLIWAILQVIVFSFSFFLLTRKIPILPQMYLLSFLLIFIIKKCYLIRKLRLWKCLRILWVWWITEVRKLWIKYSRSYIKWEHLNCFSFTHFNKEGRPVSSEKPVSKGKMKNKYFEGKGRKNSTWYRKF